MGERTCLHRRGASFRLRFESSSASETQRLGKALARLLKPGDVLGLKGPLGSGKTTFVQGMARGLGCREMPSSPTFVLAQTYHGRIPLHHLDFYRIREKEVMSIGIEDFYSDGGLTAIEWADRAPHFVPADRLDIVFSYRSASRRRILLVPRGKSWKERLR